MNQNFEDLIQTIRNHLPKISVAVIILVYTVSAIAEAKFLGGKPLDYAITGGVQASRAVVVFFCLLNPVRPVRSIAGAVIFGVVLAMASIYTLHEVAQDSEAFYVVALLISTGCIIELMLLSYMVFSQNYDIMNDDNLLRSLMLYHHRRDRYHSILKELNQPERQKRKETTPPPSRKNNQLSFEFEDDPFLKFPGFGMPQEESNGTLKN